MDWNAVRKVNRRRSERKAAREQHAAAQSQRIAEAGGPITLAEIRNAEQVWEKPAPGHVHERWVFLFRGRFWRVGYSDGVAIHSMCPHVDWQQEPDMRNSIPFTPAARKWFNARLAQEPATP